MSLTPNVVGTASQALGGRHIIIETQMGDAGEVIASHPQIHTYGVGETSSEALDDFVSMLIDLYDELTESEHMLSRHLQEQWHFLRSVFPRLRFQNRRGSVSNVVPDLPVI